MSSLEIAIAGAGYAGAASAALLARAGHHVTLLEEVREPTAVGAGIVLQPTGLSVLAELGVLDQVLAQGARIDSLHCVTPRQRTVVELRYADLRQGLFGLGVHRGVLFRILLDAAQSRGARLECGVSVRALHERGRRVLIEDAEGKRRGPFDLLVIASGARSTLRRKLGLVQRERAYPWGALWFVARHDGTKYPNCLRQVAHGTRRFLGLLPTGRDPRSKYPEQAKMSLFWSIRMSDVEAFRKRDLDSWKSEVLGYEPDAEAVLGQIESTEQLLAASYWDVVLREFHTHNVVCIGDAGHAMSPQLGQGCNLALCDALSLAYCLGQRQKLETALAMFSARRRMHLDYYQFASRWLTPLFQSDYDVLGPVRDLGMALACRVPALRRRMLLTMAGVGAGIVRTAFPLPELAPNGSV